MMSVVRRLVPHQLSHQTGDCGPHTQTTRGTWRAHSGQTISRQTGEARWISLHEALTYKCTYFTKRRHIYRMVRQMIYEYIICPKSKETLQPILHQGHIRVQLLAAASASLVAASFLLPSLALRFRLPFRKLSVVWRWKCFLVPTREGLLTRV